MKVQIEQAKKESEMIRRAYEEKVVEERKVLDLFKRANEIKIKLAAYSKEVEFGTCGTCRKILRIIDGRAPC